MSPVDSANTLRLERTFDAPAEDVFDAWTNPEVLRRWWVVNPEWRTPTAEVDLRVGGAYRLTMEDPAGDTRHTVRGEYREVRRPERLVYSWCWEEGDGSTGHVSTVTVEFVGDGERTTVVLEHSDLPSQQSAEQHRVGWEGCLANLGARIFAPASQPS
jgi:uncharacterized protein YndB with AHSA1/START domain